MLLIFGVTVVVYLQEYIYTVLFLYTGPVSNKIERILSKENIKVYHSTSIKLFQWLFAYKDKTEKNQHPRVLCIPCKCGLGCIGETGRTIMAHNNEHYKCYIEDQTEKSFVAKHTRETSHRIEWDKTTLLSNRKDYFSGRMHATIPQEGQPSNDTWTALFS